MGNNREYNKPHDLKYYKTIYEQYELRVNEKNNYIGAIDRKTGKEVESENDNYKLYLDLMFAQSWIDACKSGIPYNGKINDYGVEVKQWEYAFNEEAQSTYSWLLGLIKYCADNNQKLNAQEMATFVKQKTKYKYSDEIVAHLLGSKNYIDSKDSFDFQELKRVNARKTLLTNAGINSNKSDEVFKDR